MKRVAREEGILLSPSAGAALLGALEVAARGKPDREGNHRNSRHQQPQDATRAHARFSAAALAAVRRHAECMNIDWLCSNECRWRLDRYLDGRLLGRREDRACRICTDYPRLSNTALHLSQTLTEPS